MIDFPEYGFLPRMENLMRNALAIAVAISMSATVTAWAQNAQAPAPAPAMAPPAAPAPAKSTATIRTHSACRGSLKSTRPAGRASALSTSRLMISCATRKSCSPSTMVRGRAIRRLCSRRSPTMHQGPVFPDRKTCRLASRNHEAGGGWPGIPSDRTPGRTRICPS